jgi:hypothetical protein
MKTALYIISILLLIVWVVGAFLLKAGLFIHIFFMVGAIVGMQGLIVCPKTPTIARS